MTTTTTCDQVTAELSDLIDGDPAAIGRHADHLAGCADCRDARHDAARLAALVADAGIDHAPPGDLAARVLAALDRSMAGRAAAAEPDIGDSANDGAARREDPPSARHRAPSPRAATQRGWQAVPTAGRPASQGSRQRRWAAVAAATAIAAAAAAMVVRQAGQPAGTAANESSGALAAGGPVGVVTRLERAGVPGAETGVALHEGARWRSLGRDEVVPAGAELRTDDRTRAALTLADGTQLVLDHSTMIAFAPDDARRIRLTAGRLAADLAQLSGRSATITTPTGRIDVAAAAGSARAADPRGANAAPDLGDASRSTDRGARLGADGARFTVTAAEALTSVQVARDAVVLANQRGERDEVRAGEEGVVEAGALSVSPAPGLVRDAAWAELAPPAQPDEAASGLGALRAYKPGEQRDRDWNLALARHDVKVRVVGPIARTEITETFRNDSAATLEGVYQFPLPPDAQIDGLALDVAGGFVDGAFVDKERGQKIWRGVIDRATPRSAPRPSQEIIWVEGRWRDPALLDWKRGGRFELRVYPIPAHGARTIKLAYTQVVAPRGPWREYSYPLPHSRDGSTVADLFTVDVELRGAVAGQVRAAGYDLVADPARAQVNALTLRQSGFVPRGDLVIAYRAEAGDAELRAWTFAGGAAAAPDDKLAGVRGVGIDPKVVEAQRAIAADLRPTAVVALRPRLPRWRDGAPRDYMIVVDASQSMVGERFTRATELAAAIVEQMDRRDRFGAMVCDSECRSMGDPAGPATGQAIARSRAGASDPANGTGTGAVIDPSAPIATHAARAAVTAGAAALRSPSPQAAGDVRGWLAAQQPAGASDVVAALRAAGVRLGPGRGPADDEDGGRASDRRTDREPWILYIGDGFASTGFRRVSDVERAVASAAGPPITAIGIGSDADAAVLQAAARGGGGSYLAWLPGQRTSTAAAAALASTLGAALRDAVVELPAGLSDVAPSVLPTVRAGEEVLIAARIATGPGATGEVAGDVVLRGRVAGQPFEQRYPIRLAASAAAGNGFVPRLWASLAIDQLERAGTAADRARIVALSQGYGVMSRETSLLVLESQAMFDAFGVDRHRPTATWTGEDALDEVAAAGTIALDASNPYSADPAGGASPNKSAKGDSAGRAASSAAPAPVAPTTIPPADKDLARKRFADAKKAPAHGRWSGADAGLGAGWVQLRRRWVRVPSVAPYDAVQPAIAAAIADAEAGLAAHPDSRERHRALVQALSYAGELGRARDAAQRWLDRDQLDPQALGYLADLLGRDGQRERSLRTLAGLVDLDPDRAALHDRMARGYEQVGRLAQACAHRIALAALQPQVPAAAAGALRCLRALGRPGDADLILRALPDDASRAQAEKAALIAPAAPPIAGDLVVKARWDGGTDLDLTLVTPDGTRVSWMGGRSDAAAADVTAGDRESLAVKALRRGNYLVEISRAAASPTAPAPAVRGTLEITALGARRAIPFELTGARAVIGRVAIHLVERFEDLDGTPVQLYQGPGRRIIPDRPKP